MEHQGKVRAPVICVRANLSWINQTAREVEVISTVMERFIGKVGAKADFHS